MPARPATIAPMLAACGIILRAIAVRSDRHSPSRPCRSRPKPDGRAIVVIPPAQPSAPYPTRRTVDRAWCADGLPDLCDGAAFLVTALFFYVRADFGVAGTFLVAGVAGVSGFREALATTKAALAEPAPGAAFHRLCRSRPPRQRTAGTPLLLAPLVVLAANRVSRLEPAAGLPQLTWSIRRWCPPVLTVPIAACSVASAFRLRFPRHVAFGLVGLGGAGAVAGPFLGLAWRDGLPIAAVSGFAPTPSRRRRTADSAPAFPPASMARPTPDRTGEAPKPRPRIASDPASGGRPRHMRSRHLAAPPIPVREQEGHPQSSVARPCRNRRRVARLWADRRG